MALKYRITKEDFEKLSETLQGEYVEKNGEYVLDVDGADDGAEIKRALEHERGETKQSKAKIAELNKRLEEIETERNRKENNVEALEKSWQDKLSNKEKEWQDREGKYRTTLDNQIRMSKAQEIASKISSAPKLIAPLIAQRMQTDFESDEPTLRILDGKGELSSMSLEELESEFVNDKELASVIIGSKASGGGGAPSSLPGGGTSGGKPQKSFSEMSPEELDQHFSNQD